MTKEHSGCSSSRLHVVGKTLKRCHIGYWGWCFRIFSTTRHWEIEGSGSRCQMQAGLYLYISTFMSGTFINRFVSYLCENMHRLLSKHSVTSCCLSQLFNTLWNQKMNPVMGDHCLWNKTVLGLNGLVCQAWLMPTSPSPPQKKNSTLSKVSSFSIQA